MTYFFFEGEVMCTISGTDVVLDGYYYIEGETIVFSFMNIDDYADTLSSMGLVLDGVHSFMDYGAFIEIDGLAYNIIHD